ncbi:MAG: amidohydrolase family protein [Bryobacteraceae bacterium]|nr:amidohydrolase family protein [Bryobacteraceae bacterium]
MPEQQAQGINLSTGEAVVADFSTVIEAVEPDLTGGSGQYLAPGFIDLQVNGFAGVDYNSPAAPHEEIARSLLAIFATGVTRFYPTVITGSAGDMTGALKNLAAAKAKIPHGAAIEGFHVEGPFISAEDGPRGAHPRHCVRAPSVEEYRRFQEAADGQVRLMTVAPEWPGITSLIETMVQDGVVVSIGHTAASAEQINEAVRAGATMSTHLGNGAHGELRRHPNYLWDQMANDHLTASFITDGIHIGENFFRVALRAKGIERCVLVTDAVMPAGCAPGDYMLGEIPVTLHPGDRVTLRGGTRLAGAALKMHDGIAHAMRLGQLSLRDAVTMATTNAARAGRISGRWRGLQAGERADLVEFDYSEPAGRLTVRRVWLSGERVYRA